jgi:hypothetical protein
MKRDIHARVCVIGAGPSGITAAKNLLQVGVRNLVVYERGDQVGGNWVYSPRLSHSSVFDTTHIISSKSMSQYEDFPMPAHYPDYPSHKQVLAYFQSYADYFGVTDYIRFNTEVERAEELPDKTWRVTLNDGTVEIFDHLFVCNGHHWDPRVPEYPGRFDGDLLHSHEYKTAAPFRDKRVLVVGGGNSACDIAVETGRVSAMTALSMRRGYWFIPKHIAGIPSDVLHAQFARVPRALRMPFLRLALMASIGLHRFYGLQRPDHGLMRSHLVANSELLYFIRHGKVHVRRDIRQFSGEQVEFVDGKVEPYDVVLFATGFKLSFPFFERDFLDFDSRDVPLYLRVFHPDHPSLAFIGLVQPQGCIWPLADAHAKLAANYVIGAYDLPADMRQRIAAQIEHQNRFYIQSARHNIEVEYHHHLWELQREMPRHAPRWTLPVRRAALDAG